MTRMTVAVLAFLLLVGGVATATLHQQSKASDRIIWTPGGPSKAYNNTNVQQHEKVVPDLLITCQGHTEQWCDGYQAGWADGQLGILSGKAITEFLNSF